MTTESLELSKRLEALAEWEEWLNSWEDLPESRVVQWAKDIRSLVLPEPGNISFEKIEWCNYCQRNVGGAIKHNSECATMNKPGDKIE